MGLKKTPYLNSQLKLFVNNQAEIVGSTQEDISSLLQDEDRMFLQQYPLSSEQIDAILALASSLPKLCLRSYNSEEEYSSLLRVLPQSSLFADPQYKQLFVYLSKCTQAIKDKYHQETWNSFYTILHSLILSALHTYFHKNNKDLRMDPYLCEHELLPKIKARILMKYNDLLLRGIPDQYLSETSYRQKKHIHQKQHFDKIDPKEQLHQSLIADFVHIKGIMEEEVLNTKEVGALLSFEESSEIFEKAWSAFVENHKALNIKELHNLEKELGSMFGY